MMKETFIKLMTDDFSKAINFNKKMGITDYSYGSKISILKILLKEDLSMYIFPLESISHDNVFGLDKFIDSYLSVSCPKDFNFQSSIFYINSVLYIDHYDGPIKDFFDGLTEILNNLFTVYHASNNDRPDIYISGSCPFIALDNYIDDFFNIFD